MDYRELTAYCGIDCFNCDVFEGNLNDEKRKIFAEKFGLPAEKVGCRGCKVEGGCRLHWNKCDTLDCIREKGHDFCYECKDFPCNMLLPAADGAERLPHNMKVFNLCKIKNMGIEKWAEDASETRKRYFKGKMVIGKGPQI